ncbi:HAD family phosphatase [bacterium]|nr:HAD family phosphatase [bacterium]
MLKAAIFDLDGVLINTEPYQWFGWIEVLKPYDAVLSKEEYISNYAGKSGIIIEEELLKKFSLSIEKGALLREKEKLLLQWFKEKEIELMPYAKESVEFFLNKNLKTALISGGPRDEVILKLKRTGLFPLFSVILSGSDVKRGKPNPDVYLLGLERLEVESKSCIVFEDTAYGLEAATRAGIKCLAIPNEFSREQDFSKATKVFNNLKEAVGWVEDKYIAV